MVSRRRGTDVEYATHALCNEDKVLYLRTTPTDLSRVSQAGNDRQLDGPTHPHPAESIIGLLHQQSQTWPTHHGMVVL